ncbi:MAG: PIG-U family protein, partial [archaeon]|nr:PIG-U family protein [archaeon]
MKDIISFKNLPSKFNKERNHFILGLYLYNPVSIIACACLRLDVFFTFLNLFFISVSENVILGPIILFLSTILSPGYAIINYTYLIYLSLFHPNPNRKFLKNFVFILVSYFMIFGFIIKGNFNPFRNISYIYNNYYFLKDSKPNFAFYWDLYASTFIKYQRFTLVMALFYHVSLCIATMFLISLVKDKDYEFKPSLMYSLIFLISHILDTYPSEMHCMIGLILVYQHWEVIKVKISTLSIYCSAAGYLLIMSRGFPYLRRKTGQSNYLYFQNITYEIAMSMVVMTSLNGVVFFKKKCKHYDKMKKITNFILDKAMEKINEKKKERNKSINDTH